MSKQTVAAIRDLATAHYVAERCILAASNLQEVAKEDHFDAKRLRSCVSGAEKVYAEFNRHNPLDESVLIVIRRAARQLGKMNLVSVGGVTAPTVHEVAFELFRKHWRQLDTMAATSDMVDTPRDYAFDLDEVERQVGRICKRIRELPAFDANDALSRLRIEADEALDTAEESQDKAKTELSPTERKIISLCRRKSLPATAIARKTELSDDHVRRVLAKLRKAGRLTNGPGGYRTVRVT